MKNIVIIPCSGDGKRMNSDIPKQFIKVNNKPIICYTIEKFENCELIDEIILVTNKNYIEYFKNNILKIYNYKKIKEILIGGKERFYSVYNGIKSINESNSIILIHDGVRPFINPTHIKNIIKQTNEYGACVLGVKTKDTIKICSNKGFIKNTPRRDYVWIAQTPQAFKYNIIKKAYENYIHKNYIYKNYIVTDDASLVEMIGYKVKMIEGDYENIKITTSSDLKFFK